MQILGKLVIIIIILSTLLNTACVVDETSPLLPGDAVFGRWIQNSGILQYSTDTTFSCGGLSNVCQLGSLSNDTIDYFTPLREDTTTACLLDNILVLRSDDLFAVEEGLDTCDTPSNRTGSLDLRDRILFIPLGDTRQEFRNIVLDLPGTETFFAQADSAYIQVNIREENNPQSDELILVSFFRDQIIDGMDTTEVIFMQTDRYSRNVTE